MDIKEEMSLKKATVDGAFYLTIRRVTLLITAFFSNVILARLLMPKDFGLFVFVSFIISFFYTISELGLNSAIIQKNKEVSQSELTSSFLITAFIGLLFSILLYFTANLLYIFFPTYTIEIIQATKLMSISLLISVLSVVPMALLERAMNYRAISFIEVFSSVLYQIFAIIFALIGYGAMSFVYAYLILVSTATILSFVFTKWIPNGGVNGPEIMRLIKFGLPYQASNVIGMVKDSSMTFLAGVFVGAQGLGYLNWAKNTTTVSSMVTDGYGRVAFSAMSKIQSENLKLQNGIEKSMRILTFITFPLIVALFLFSKDIIHYIYTDKWLPALPALYLFTFSTITVGISVPVYRAILSLGKSMYIFKSSILLLILEWGLGLPMVILFSFNGIAVASVFISFIILFVYIHYLRMSGINPKIWTSINKNLLISIFCLFVGIILNISFSFSFIHFLILVLIYLALYLLLSILLNMSIVKEVFGILRIYLSNKKNFI
jgi:O-antigen/teichoic acid export membrane protein